MDAQRTTQTVPPVAVAGMDYSEESIPENDEPPDTIHELRKEPLKHSTFTKAGAPVFQRRESLLTRQLHSETEHTDDDDEPRGPPRALSMQSTSSTRSGASLDLISDDGRSTPSPTLSPPFLPATTAPSIVFNEKNLYREPVTLRPEEKSQPNATDSNVEKSVEQGLGRKRCISFACGNKPKEPVDIKPKEEVSAVPAPTPARKCAIKFVCPTRTSSQSEKLEKPVESAPVSVKLGTQRASSPLPRQRKRSSSPRRSSSKGSRGSFSTIVDASSPKSVRKASAGAIGGSKTTSSAGQAQQRKVYNDDDSDASTAATRFHEFASSEDEPEEWVMESTCHRSRLTVSDTLRKENIIRKACEEVEDEAVEEEDADEEEEELREVEDLDDLDADDADEADEEEDEEATDDGFRTDDEGGFAESDSEGEESDEEWWRPGGRSTAATSVDHLDRLVARSASAHESIPSSPDSAQQESPPSRVIKKTRSARKIPTVTSAVGPSSPGAHDLPDSTDFVCGTLDEDRPLEQAYLNNMKQREAAKHKTRPQDIDPTFPTSDPELDEEDDEDLVKPEESENEPLMHGDLDELDGEPAVRRRSSLRNPAKGGSKRSPPPPRRRSPAPVKRPVPNRSPPLPAALPLRRTARSPPPPTVRKATHSPKRALSPVPVKLRGQPAAASALAQGHLEIPQPHVLDIARPQLTHTASLPRGGYNFLNFADDESPLAETPRPGELPKRGAIDIVKGLERKRQRRKEKLYQKACAKAAAKGEKVYKVKPGKGAQRMREVGLESQRYHGKGGHILSM